MHNKKLKSYLEYKIVHPKPSGDYQTLLKLKAFQKSRQKSHQKNLSIEKIYKSHNHSQSFAETTQSTFMNNRSSQKSRNKQKQVNLTSINKQIKQLQEKVDVLLTEHTPEKFINYTRSNHLWDGSRGKQKRLSSDRKNVTQNGSLLKNERLRQSLLKTSNSLESSSQRQKEQYQHNKSLIILKMQACKLLTNLNIEPQRLDYFQKANNIEDIFQMLHNLLAINFAQIIIQSQDKVRESQEEFITSLKIQVDRLRLHCRHLDDSIVDLREDRAKLQDTNLQLKLQIQKKQTEIYQLKMQNDQSQNELLRTNLQHLTECSQQKAQLKLSYQKKIYQKINSLQYKQLQQTRLQQILINKIYENDTLQTNRSILSQQIQKWEKQFIRLKERYQLQKTQRMGVEEERNLEVQVYEQYREVMRDGYFRLVDRLGKEIQGLRDSQVKQAEVIEKLRADMKRESQRVKEYENDYLCLNEDYSKDVREWVAKQEYYDKTIKQLRNQVQQSYETIAEYSKMLATSKIKYSILDTTQNE